jgi:hypothetical protein
MVDRSSHDCSHPQFERLIGGVLFLTDRLKICQEKWRCEFLGCACHSLQGVLTQGSIIECWSGIFESNCIYIIIFFIEQLFIFQRASGYFEARDNDIVMHETF